VSGAPLTVTLDIIFDLHFILGISMSRWTNKPYEIQKISELSRQLAGSVIVHVVLENGISIEGAIRNIQIGNNASSIRIDGGWNYYGNFDIEALDNQLFNIDFCDVKSITNMWNERKEQYEKAGLIQIIPNI